MPQGDTYDYDLITIGAGSGGVRASRRAAGLGKRACVIENLRVGGTCVMRGCVPKKLLVIGSHFADAFEDAAHYGWQVPAPGLDWGKLIEAKNAELDRLEGVYHRILKDSGVDELFGTGRVRDAHTVEVETGDGKRTITAEHILVATGGWPSLPDVPGIEHAITSNEALELAELPKRVAIVGGGYIAVEFAGIFNGYGSQVTEIIRRKRILHGFDDDVRETLQAEMTKKGVTIKSETKVTAIGKTAGGLTLSLEDGGTMETDLVMYATGRAPNTGNIGLEDAGVRLTEKGAIRVDEYSRSSVPSIHAIGDVTDRLALTPVAIAEGEALVRTLFGNAPTPVDHADVPSAVFSQPPIGTVGLTEAQARGKADIDVYVTRFRPMKATLTGRDEKTMMKMVVDRASDRVLGCHMVGDDAPEIIQGIAVAVKSGATKAQFDATVGIHPTAAEEFVTLREKRAEPDRNDSEDAAE